MAWSRRWSSRSSRRHRARRPRPTSSAPRPIRSSPATISAIRTGATPASTSTSRTAACARESRSQCGAKSDAPIESLTVHGGTLDNHQTMLPVAYGSTSIWAVERGSHVVAASTPIYFPNPTIPNLQTPPDVNAPDATYCTSFEKKFVTVDHATGSGELLGRLGVRQRHHRHRHRRDRLPQRLSVRVRAPGGKAGARPAHQDVQRKPLQVRRLHRDQLPDHRDRRDGRARCRASCPRPSRSASQTARPTRPS